MVKLKNKKSDIFIMADGGYFGFDDSRIVAKIMDKHLIDFSCLRSIFAYRSGAVEFHQNFKSFQHTT